MIEAGIEWVRQAGEAFTDRRYSRAHRLTFDGGLTVPGSSSPHVVPLPFSVAENVDPEESFLAAIAACHMLWFLDLAARAGFMIDSYRDAATAEMAKDVDGVTYIARATLRPRVAYSGTTPDAKREAELHEAAHHNCFIARSVRTEITIEPR